MRGVSECCIPDRCGGAESSNQDPWPDATLGVRDSRNSGAQTETFEGLMEEDGDEKDDEALGGNGNGHSDEDGVEQDTTLKEGNIERHLLQDQRVDSGFDVIIIELGQFLGGDIGFLGLSSIRGKARHVASDHVVHLVTLTDVLLVECHEPCGHLSGAVTTLEETELGQCFSAHRKWLAHETINSMKLQYALLRHAPLLVLPDGFWGPCTPRRH